MALLLQHPLLFALITLVLVFATAAWLLGVFEPERSEAQAGLEQLRAMNRDQFHALITQILTDRGMQVLEEHEPGQDGLDLIFTRGKSRYLMLCRNDENQRVTSQTVSQLRKMMSQHGAEGAYIVSCNALDTPTFNSARQNGIRVMAGETLWQDVKPWIDHGQLVDAQTHLGKTRRKRILQASAVALPAALVVFLGLHLAAPPQNPDPARIDNPSASTPNTTPMPMPSAPGPAAPETTSTPSGNSPAPVSIANLSQEQLESRRASALLDVRGLILVSGANWTTRFTVHIELHDHVDGDAFKALVTDICQALLQNEELRYTRLQIDVPTGNPETPIRVRWQQCQ